MNATGGRSRKALWRRISPRVMWGDWLKWRRTKSPFDACLDLLFGYDRPRAGDWEWPWWEEDVVEQYNNPCEVNR
jgi:hypothetical protein